MADDGVLRPPNFKHNFVYFIPYTLFRILYSLYFPYKSSVEGWRGVVEGSLRRSTPSLYYTHT